MRENLIRARKKARLTQKEISQKIGITERHYKSLEAGTSDGSVRVWQRLKEITGESIDYLLEQENNPKEV